MIPDLGVYAAHIWAAWGLGVVGLLGFALMSLRRMHRAEVAQPDQDISDRGGQ